MVTLDGTVTAVLSLARVTVTAPVTPGWRATVSCAVAPAVSVAGALRVSVLPLLP